MLLRNTIQLLSGHEFRTPIHGIMGCSEFLQNVEYELQEDERREFASNINVSAKRLMALSERLNVWYSLFSETSTARRSKFLLCTDELQEMVTQEADKLLPSGQLVRFTTNMSDCLVLGSKESFETAIRELLQNAFRFSAKNEIVAVSVQQNSREVVVRISNRSAAATVDELKTYTVFTQFHRKKLEQQGLGLGMEIARLGISQCGGYINIHNGVSPEDRDLVVFDISMRREFLEE